MKKFRFHLLSLTHLPQSKMYQSCAFTQKNLKLSKMLMSLGHEVFFYGPEGSNPVCTEFIQTHTIKDIACDYGDGDNRFEVGYDWTNTDFRHDFNTKRKISTLKFISTSIVEINKRKKEDDFLLLTQGMYFRPIALAVNLFLTCEPGVGYRGSYCRFRAFESSYIQNFTYGGEHPKKCISGNYYDRVIPNYFDPDDILFSDIKEDYFLFIGRMIRRKGIVIAHKVTELLGKKLIIAGQGGIETGNKLSSQYPNEFTISGNNFQYVGFADIKKRKELMAHAKATFTPTEYMECFAGTHIESMLSGTPVITTNFGVFPGTVINGVNGYRCDTLDDFVWAAKNISNLNSHKIRDSAKRYLMENVKWDFQKWFEDLYFVYESAQDSKKKGFNRICEYPRSFREKIYW